MSSSWQLSCCLTAKSYPTLLKPNGLYVAHQAPLSMGFPRQDYWSGLSFPSPGDLSDPGIKTVSVHMVISSVAPHEDLELPAISHLHSVFNWHPFFFFFFELRKILTLLFSGRNIFEVMLLNLLAVQTWTAGCLAHFQPCIRTEHPKKKYLH